MPVKRGRGRPSHVPTKTTRGKVEELKMGGMNHDQIALCLQISGPTLEKHYPDELKNGATRRFGELLGISFKQARKGSNPAIKRLLEIGSATIAAKNLTEDPSEGAEEAAETVTPSAPLPTGTKKGKKEEANDAAKVAGIGTTWGEDLIPPGMRGIVTPDQQH